jgi:hypothetical protein
VALPHAARKTQASALKKAVNDAASLRTEFLLWTQQKPSHEGFLMSKKLKLKAQ